MTAVLHELRENLTLTREVYGRSASQTQAAFELLVRTAANAGTPLDGLRNYVADEVERFFSQTLQGPDGHVYWSGNRDFTRNDGGTNRAPRWWWNYRNGKLADTEDIVPVCGERNCINPEHHVKQRIQRGHVRWTEDRIIGALQVVALRLGHTPSTVEWEKGRYQPVGETIYGRFGSWERAVTAAGLAPVVNPLAATSKADVLAGIRLVRKVLGKWPSDDDYTNCRKELRAANLPTTTRPAKRHYTSFSLARVAAGGPESLRSDGQSGRTDPRGADGATAEDCLKGILLVREQIGRWPSGAEYVGERDLLLAADLPASAGPMRRLFGSFTAARVAAGGPSSVRDQDYLRPHVARTTPEVALAGLRLVHDILGHWPTRHEYAACADALAAAGFPISEGPAIKLFGSFTAARVAAGGPAQLPGGQAARRLREDTQATKGTVT